MHLFLSLEWSKLFTLLSSLAKFISVPLYTGQSLFIFSQAYCWVQTDIVLVLSELPLCVTLGLEAPVEQRSLGWVPGPQRVCVYPRLEQARVQKSSELYESLSKCKFTKVRAGRRSRIQHKHKSHLCIHSTNTSVLTEYLELSLSLWIQYK